MHEKIIIDTTERKRLEVVIQYVFRASFNDTYYLEEFSIELAKLDKEQPMWIDPFAGRSKSGETMVAITYYSDDEFVILEKTGDKIKESKVKRGYDYIVCEDYDESMLLATHIRMT